VKILVTNHGTVDINDTHYSPDLARTDTYIFSTVKMALKRKRFQDAEHTEEKLLAELNGVLLQDFADCSNYHVTRRKKEFSWTKLL
jgi:hypothetical protein